MSSFPSTEYHHPQTVEELTQRNVETIVRLDEAAQEKRTRGDRIVDAIAQFCGHMGFVWLHLVWFAIWIGFNTFLPVHHFDPFPFQFLTFMVSLEAIFLSAFILISQNRDAQISERRNHLDLQINLLSEQENTKILQMLNRIADKLEIEIDEDDPTTRILENATQPDKLIEQIEASHQKAQDNEIKRTAERAGSSALAEATAA